MKKSAFFLLFFTFFSCNSNENIPDVSGIQIKVNIQRFERDFFALDTLNLLEGVRKLQQKNPGFTNDFVANILGLDVAGLKSNESPEAQAIKKFLKDYRPLKDSAEEVFGNFEGQIKELKKSLQYVKHYFPQYKIPENIITFIGPVDAFFQTSFGTTGDVITREGLAIGLQLHLGSNFSYYRTSPGQELYPPYISTTFAPEYITINCMKNIIDDMYEDKSIGKPLIEQMVEKGKRLYLLDKLTPATPAHLKISYTKKQLDGAYKNEAVILDFFLRNELMNNADQNITKNYIGETPKTPELGEDAPGNIGSFTGWQIVKKFMVTNPGTTLQKMMTTDAREIYTSAKYKPRS